MPPRRHPALAAACAAAACALAAAGCGAREQVGVPTELLTDPGPQRALRVRATVAWVIDGDTFDARVGGRRMRVRLLGIDAPESVKRDAPVECYGPEASRRLKLLLPEGSRVTVETDVGGDRRDRFGRLLAYATPAGSRVTANATMLREGFADLYVFHAVRPFYRAQAFRALRDEARDARRAMWGACPHPEQH